MANLKKSDVLQIEHSEFGPEEFPVSQASYNLFQREDEERWELVISLKTRKATLRSKELLEDDAKPTLEASAILPKEPKLRKGTVIEQDKGYDRKTDENLSSLYYFEHESVEKLRFRVLELGDGWVDAEVRGVAVINGSKGRKPDASFAVRARFKKKARLYRSFE